MLEIEVKEDSPEKLAAVAGKPTKNYLFAAELNSIVASVKKSESKFIQLGEKFVFKDINNNLEKTLQPGDFVVGNVDDTFIIGQFSPKNETEIDENDLANYLIILSKENFVDNNVSQSNSYSTDEILTGGTWIDGKPIYRKVIPGTTNSSGWWQMTGLGTSIFLKNFVSMNVLHLNGTTYQTIKSAVNNSGSLIVIPSSIAGTTPWIGVQSYITSSSTPISISFVVILEYTKTTD